MRARGAADVELLEEEEVADLLGQLLELVVVDLGSTIVIQRRFNVSIPRARVP